jgi:hypothetical protein
MNWLAYAAAGAAFLAYMFDKLAEVKADPILNANPFSLKGSAVWLGGIAAACAFVGAAVEASN